MVRLIIILMLGLIVPAAHAEETLESALKSGQYVFMYAYSDWCGSCKRFNPIYADLEKKHKDYKFVKINTQTPYGQKIGRHYNIRYIPFTAVFNSKTNSGEIVPLRCAFDSICLNNFVNEFKKK